MMKKMYEKTLPKMQKKSLGNLKKWLAATAVAAMLMPGTMAVPAAENIQSDLPQEELIVHFIDVGQGLAIMAQAGDNVLVYDGGNSDAASYFVSYLQQEGVEDIDYMIASHYDADHLNGLVGALHAFDTDTIIAPDYEHNSKIYKSFYDTLSTEGKEVTYPEVGEEYAFGDGSFTILGPTQIRDDSNNNSVVIRLDYGETSFLFTGDAESKEEKDIIAANENLDCDVLSVGHHGSASSTSWDFLEAVLPEYAVISCGVNNSYGHPDSDTVEKLESVEAQIFRTDFQGNIIATSDGETITWNNAPSNGEVLYAADFVSVKEEPNNTSSTIGELGPGNQIQVLNRDDNGWATIVFNGATTYIPSSYLSDVDPQTMTQAAPTQAAVQAQTPSTQPQTAAPTQSPQTEAPTQPPQTEAPTQPVGNMVWLSATGSKYHSRNNCGNMNPENARQVTESDAINQGYEKCKKCW